MPEGEVVKMKVRRKAIPAPVSAPAEAAPKPKKAKKAASNGADRKVAARYTGRSTGLPVRDFQNQLLARNFKSKLTDAQLAKAMRDEFPDATAYSVEHVVGIRSAWNKGHHGNDVPVKPLHAYDEAGVEQPLWGEKTRLARREREAKAGKSAASAATAAAKNVKPRKLKAVPKA